MSTIVAIVGILIFQIYWVTTTYDSQERTFEVQINSAMKDVLNQQIRDMTLKQYSDAQKDPVDGIRTKVEKSWIAGNDSVIVWGEEALETWTYEINGSPAEITIDPGEADELYNIVIRSLIFHQPDLKNLEKRYKVL